MMAGLALVLTFLALVAGVFTLLVLTAPVPLDRAVEEALRYDKTHCPDCGVDVWAEEP